MVHCNCKFATVYNYTHVDISRWMLMYTYLYHQNTTKICTFISSIRSLLVSAKCMSALIYMTIVIAPHVHIHTGNTYYDIHVCVCVCVHVLRVCMCMCVWAPPHGDS